MAMKLGNAVLVAVTLVGWGVAALPAQQSATQPSERDPLVLMTTNISAQQDSAAGRPRLEAERKAARPGDVMEHRLVFTNPRATEVKDLVLENPVPEGMSFVANSAGSDRAGVQVEYSIDGGRTWSARPEIEVVDEGGQRVRRPAPPEQYTNVRWTLTGSVAPGAQVEARYRTRVREPVH
jgi:uncharacterized repeat protein (TIGR01451 family)